MAHTAPDVKHLESSRESTSRLAAAVPALLAIAFGILLLYGANFARPQAVHDAAHDSRHALAFPCH